MALVILGEGQVVKAEDSQPRGRGFKPLLALYTWNVNENGFYKYIIKKRKRNRGRK